MGQRSGERFLVVRRLDDRTEVNRVDVTGRGERDIERVMIGMLINMHEDFFIADTADEAAS